MAVINGLDTNSQSDRDKLRSQGYYIDNSGVYAPGAGQRAGDTFSGAQASKNEAPSPTQLPVINGTPVSPSNGFTGPQTPGIMYRGDPQYASLFGPGTPGYSSTSQTYNATPGALPAGQQTLGDITPTAPAPGPVSPPANAPVKAPASVTVNPGQDVTDQAQWLKGITSTSPGGYGYGPYATPDVPSLTTTQRYVDGNGQLIEKSVDQFGHEYYRTVSGNVSIAAPSDQSSGQPVATATPPPASQPAAATADQTTAAAVTPKDPREIGPNGERMHTFIGADGKPVTAFLTEQDYQGALTDMRNAQEAQRQAQQFSQGIEQGKLDLDKMTAAYNQSYQQNLLDYNNRALAQKAATDAMNQEYQKQVLALQQLQQQQLVEYQQQQLAFQKQQQGQTNSIEQEKLQLQRQQLRGHRSLPNVRFR